MTTIFARDLRPFDALVEYDEGGNLRGRVVVSITFGAPIPGPLPCDPERPGVWVDVAPRRLYELSRRIDFETMQPLYDGPMYDAETLQMGFGDWVEVER